MSRRKIIALILPVGLLAAGCNGGGDDGAAGAVINGENTISYGKEATTSLNELVAASEDLTMVMSQFGAMSTGKSGPATTEKFATARTEDVIQCAGGGTVTITSSEASATEQTIHLSADRCVDETGADFHGELEVSIGPWDEFQNSTTSSAVEMVMTTGTGGLAAGDCEFNGGLVMRFHAVTNSPDANGGSSFVFEYGTTDDGFISFCQPDQQTSIAANTLVRNEFTYAYAADGSMTSSSDVSIRGGFEAPDGSGFVTVFAENLEYEVTTNGTSTLGAGSCPSGGEMTLTGADNSTASFFFGDDAPAGYEVQVTGPDGFVAEFETCEDFLAAAG